MRGCRAKDEENDGGDIFSDAEATPVAAAGAAALSPARHSKDAAPGEASGTAAKPSNGSRKQQQVPPGDAAQGASKLSAASSSGAAAAATPATTDEADEERRQRLRQVRSPSTPALLHSWPGKPPGA